MRRRAVFSASVSSPRPTPPCLRHITIGVFFRLVLKWHKYSEGLTEYGIIGRQMLYRIGRLQRNQGPRGFLPCRRYRFLPLLFAHLISPSGMLCLNSCTQVQGANLHRLTPLSLRLHSIETTETFLQSSGQFSNLFQGGLRRPCDTNTAVAGTSAKVFVTDNLAGNQPLVYGTLQHLVACPFG